MAYTAINDPSAHFKVQLYTGNGSANHAITFNDTDTDMQPDLVWIKNRDATDGHCIFDAVRGATKLLDSQGTAIETTDTDTLDSFTSDGFQVDADVKVNTNTEDYISWNWKAGASVSGDTSGSGTLKTYSGSVNTTAGFSIINFVGNGTSGHTIPHHLGVAPSVVIIKNTVNTESWRVGHKSILANFGNGVYLDLTNTQFDQTGAFNDTAPTSSVFTVGSFNSSNGDTDSMIAYCFADKAGYFKAGKYTGNGNANGTFVHTGFRPAMVIIKAFSGYTGNWNIVDNKRLGYNSASSRLYPNTTAADDDGDYLDLLSNGFKPLISGNDLNGSGILYVYLAFAEAPFVNSNGVPCNAR